jgi:hypothetical protein
MKEFIEIYRITFMFFGKLVYASAFLLSIIIIFGRKK